MTGLKTGKLDKLTSLSDRELLELFVQFQDEEAFSRLVQKHGPLVMGLCRRILHHQQDAEDAFQACFLVLARKAHSIHKHQSLASWLYKVAYRIALRAKAMREQRRVREQKIAAQNSLPNLITKESEIDSLVDEEIHRLPEKYRTPVLLCYLQGQSNEEAARQLDCPTGTVKVRLLRGREMLRKRLIRQGLGFSLVAWLLEVSTAQAAISPQLAQTTTQAGALFRSGLGLAHLSLPSRVVNLTQSWFKKVAVAKVKAGSALLLTVLLLLVTDLLSQSAFSAPLNSIPGPYPQKIEPALPIPEYQDPAPPQIEMVVQFRKPKTLWTR